MVDSTEEAKMTFEITVSFNTTELQLTPREAQIRPIAYKRPVVVSVPLSHHYLKAFLKVAKKKIKPRGQG